MARIRIRALLVLLLLLSLDRASTAPAPAPAPATGLDAELLCVGMGTSSETLACLGNLAITCLGAGAVTAETAYLACFITGYLSTQCLREEKKKKGCIGVDISDERMICLGLVGWKCRGSSFGDVGFVTCYIGRAIKCLVYQ